MDVRATLLWRLSQLCNSLRESPFHGSVLPSAYYLPHRKAAWEGREKVAVSLKADACLLLARGWRQSRVIFIVDTSMVIHECSNGCYTTCFPSSSAVACFIFGSKFQIERLFSLQVACNCLPGYSGDGVSQCNPINLCEQVCLPFAVARGEGHILEVFLSPNS